MEFSKREELMAAMTQSLEPMLNEHNLDEIEVYEEEGANELYYMGYTIKKGENVYMIHQPYVKNETGKLALKEHGWTIQSKQGETKGYQSLEEVFNQIQ
ncbi:DUF5634 family protein [Bacillus songklensis]